MTVAAAMISTSPISEKPWPATSTRWTEGNFSAGMGQLSDPLDSTGHYRILGLPLLNPSPPSNLKGSSQVVRWPERLADGRLLSDVAEEANAQAWAIQKRGNHGDFMGFSDGIHGNSKIVNLRWRIERWQWRI